MASKRSQREEPRRHFGKESVWRMVGKGLQSLMAGEKKSKRKPSMHSRSFAPKALNSYEDAQEDIGITGEEAIANEEFFDELIGTSMYSKPLLPRATLPPINTSKTDTTDYSAYQQKRTPVKKKQVSPLQSKQESENNKGWSLSRRRGGKPNLKKTKAEVQRAEGEGPTEDESDDDGIDMPDWIEDLWDNSDRHAAGFGIMEKIFGKSSKYVPEERSNRPFFTYWVTVVQIIMYIVSVATYGIAPIGISQTEIQDEVLMTSLAIESVAYKEIDNLWIGNKQADLIHLGAKYSPCMRVDQNIEDVLELDRNIERKTACCVYNDGSGCVQSLESECSTTLATWLNWTEANPGPNGRTSGSVCGQDPEYCTDPASTGAFAWEDDLTQWPMCIETDEPASGSEDYHMTCEVVGRPCCVGIQGECIIATREYCDFREGYFHEEASTCSQVSCMNEICAMIDFTDPKVPDQFYRLFTSLFLSSGILSLLITVLFQLTIQRDLEKLTGWFEMFVLYIGGGVVGSLASVIFIPYYVEAGASGSQFAVLAAMFLEVVRWNKDENPGKALLKIFVVLLILFLLGAIVAQIDNWAHLFGFFFGVLMAGAFRPFKSYKGEKYSRCCLMSTRLFLTFIAIGIFVLLVVFFYVAPVYDCQSCMYFNCIPFTDSYCDGMSVTISRSTTS